MSKFVKIDGKRVILSKGISAVMVSNKTMLQVNYYADGKRKRKFFELTSKGLEEAKRFNSDREREAKAHGENFGCISNEERRALELFRDYQRQAQRNGMQPESLIKTIEEAIKGFKTSSPSIPELSKSLLNKIQKDGCSQYYIQTMGTYSKIACNFFKTQQAHLITAQQITEFIDSVKLENGNEASSTYKYNIYKSLFTILGYAADKEYISHEQVTKLKKQTECPKSVKSEISALTVEDTRKIFKTIKEDTSLHQYIPLMVMGCFCGLRTVERARVQYEDIYAAGKMDVYINEDDSKTSTARYVHIQPNADKWLKFAAENGVSMDSGYIVKGETELDRISKITKITANIFKKSGVKCAKNIIRHSAATYLTELIGTGLAVNQLGHSEAICRKHYKKPVSREDAQAYFNITPDSV